MSRMIVFGLLIVAVLGVLAFIVYTAIAKAEERKMRERELEHERDMQLDETLYSDDPGTSDELVEDREK